MKTLEKLKLLDEKLELHGRDKKDFYAQLLTNARNRIQKEYWQILDLDEEDINTLDNKLK